MYNKQCSPLFHTIFFVFFGAIEKNANALLYAWVHPPLPLSFVKSFQSLLVLTDYGVSRQVFFEDKGRGCERQDATV